MSMSGASFVGRLKQLGFGPSNIELLETEFGGEIDTMYMSWLREERDRKIAVQFDKEYDKMVVRQTESRS